MIVKYGPIWKKVQHGISTTCKECDTEKMQHGKMQHGKSDKSENFLHTG